MHEFAASAQRYRDVRFCPKCGLAYRAQDFDAGACVFVCGGCRFDFFQNPLPAAVTVLAHPDHADRVLMLRRRTEPHIGRWCLPGGFLTYGETAEAAARRELLEEAGFNADIGAVLYVGLIDYSYRGRQLCVLELSFHATVRGTLPPSGQVTAEALEIDFIPVDTLIEAPDTLAFPEHVLVLQAFRAALSIGAQTPTRSAVT